MDVDVWELTTAFGRGGLLASCVLPLAAQVRAPLVHPSARVCPSSLPNHPCGLPSPPRRPSAFPAHPPNHPCVPFPSHSSAQVRSPPCACPSSPPNRPCVPVLSTQPPVRSRPVPTPPCAFCLASVFLCEADVFTSSLFPLASRLSPLTLDNPTAPSPPRLPRPFVQIPLPRRPVVACLSPVL